MKLGKLDLSDFIAICSMVLCLTGCGTVKNAAEAESQKEQAEVSLEEAKKKEEEEEKAEFEKKLSEAEPPALKYSLPPETDAKKLSGTDALKQNMKDKTVKAEYQEGRLKGWLYREGFIYEVHCQTYHSTMIQFEPGEEMAEVPYISEPDVWRLARGVGTKDGIPTQYLIIKPDFSGLSSSLIVITNKRVYQMELKSYRDHYMPTVSWVYEQQLEDLKSWIKDKKEDEFVKSVLDFSADDMKFMSFNYKIKYQWLRKKPEWKPVRVFDNGKFTYIVLDETALHTEVPAVFINGKEITNKEYHRNIIVINQLIKKVTLRLGKSKVVIKKKKGGE